MSTVSQLNGQADWSEGLRKKKQAGVGDMTLLSTITNEAINDNLKQRFNNQEIYVSYSGPVVGIADWIRHISPTS
jgi:myosin-1